MPEMSDTCAPQKLYRNAKVLISAGHSAHPLYIIVR